MSRFTLLLLYFTVCTYNVLSMCSSYGRILFLENNFVYLDGTKLIHNCLNCTLLLLLFICMKFLLEEYLISLTWIRSPNLVILLHYSPMTFSFFYLQCISDDRLQVVKVIWQKAALPPHVDGAVVLNRWRQCAPDVIHVFYVFLCHPSPQPRISSGMPGHDLSSKKLPLCIGQSGPQNSTYSLSPPESTTQMASRSVQPFLHWSWQIVPILYNGPPFPR